MSAPRAAQPTIVSITSRPAPHPRCQFIKPPVMVSSFTPVLHLIPPKYKGSRSSGYTGKDGRICRPKITWVFGFWGIMLGKIVCTVVCNATPPLLCIFVNRLCCYDNQSTPPLSRRLLQIYPFCCQIWLSRVETVSLSWPQKFFSHNFNLKLRCSKIGLDGYKSNQIKIKYCIYIFLWQTGHDIIKENREHSVLFLVWILLNSISSHLPGTWLTKSWRIGRSIPTGS